jgi:hypothetical protein
MEFGVALYSAWSVFSARQVLLWPFYEILGFGVLVEQAYTMKRRIGGMFTY